MPQPTRGHGKGTRPEGAKAPPPGRVPAIPLDEQQEVYSTMAIVSPIFGEMRGKLGGNVYSRNKGGPYVRMHAVPTNPNTARQQATRNWMSWCATAWATTLTEEQRETWREWAQTHTWKNSLGQDIALTALDWYTMVNSRLLDVADTPLTTPGDLSAPDPLLTFAITIASATTISCAFTAALPSGGYLVVWGSGPISPGADPNFKQARLIGYSAADATTPVVLTLDYTMESGRKLKCFGGVMNASGRVSTFLVSDEVYTP